MMTALVLVPSGIPLHESFGDTSSLSHKCWAGIELLCVNALLVISIATLVSLTYGWAATASVFSCEHARLTKAATVTAAASIGIEARMPNIRRSFGCPWVSCPSTFRVVAHS